MGEVYSYAVDCLRAPDVWLDMVTVELTIKTLSSHLVTGGFDSPVNSSRAPYVRVEPPSRPPLDPL
eukprot:6350273-Pyramimonas_sp.AAC.3